MYGGNFKQRPPVTPGSSRVGGTMVVSSRSQVPQSIIKESVVSSRYGAVRARETEAPRRVRFDLPSDSRSPLSIVPPLPIVPQQRATQHATRYQRGTLPGSTLATVPSLLVAARDSDYGTVTEILRRAAITGLPGHQLNAADSTGRTALSYIAANGPVSSLEMLLLVDGVDVNKADNEGNTPLHFASQAGQVEAVNYLLSQCSSIQVDARNNLGFTPLMKAAIQGRTKCAKLLLFAGASPTMRDTGRGLRAEQWARFCGRYVCADVIEKLSRHRLLERTTAYGRWGSEPELGPHLVQGRLQPPAISCVNNNTHHSSIKSRLKKAFRTTSTPSQSFSLITQLTSAALCASTPALPSPSSVPPIVKSLIRPLAVPKLQVTPDETSASSSLHPPLAAKQSL